jgi:transcriptional regulator with GAF, ATPase, and Fis domain
MMGRLRAIVASVLPGLRTLLRERVPRRRLLIVLAAFLLCSYAIGVIGYVRSTPELGIRTAFTPVVNRFYPEFLYPPEQEPLEIGDRIIRLASHPVGNWSQFLTRQLDLRDEPLHPATAAERATSDSTGYFDVDGQRIVRVTYLRDGREHQVWCRLGPAPLETILPSILWFFVKIGLFIVGAIVYWKRPEDRSARQFFLLCIVTFGAYIGGYQWSRIVTEPPLILVFIVCSVLLPAVSLHFYLVFPRPKPLIERRPRTVLAAIYALPIIFLVVFLGGYFLTRWFHHEGVEEAVGRLLSGMLVAIFCYFGIAMLWYCASVVALVHSYVTAANPTERNQVKWILYGSAAAAAPIGYTLYLAFADTARFGGGGGTWPMFAASVIVTAAFTISITRYRLMQLDQLLSSGVVYFLISSLVGLAYYALVFGGMILLGMRAGEGPSLGSVLSVSTSALVLMVFLDVVRGRFNAALHRHFHREKYQIDRTMRRMSEAIEQLVDPPTLARQLLHTSAEMLGVARGAVYLRQGEPPLYRVTDALGPAPALAELSFGCPLVEALGTRGTITVPPRGPLDAAQRQVQFLGGQIAHALLHEEQLLGLLVLGPRDGAAYTPEDLNLLAAFAQIAVLALVSAEGHRTIESLNGELKAKVDKIAEQQRRILALQSQLMSRAARTTEAGDGNGEVAASIDGEPSDGMVGSSVHMQHLVQLGRKVAASPSVVLIRGESGTGKEVLARAIHEHSPRAGRPFVKVHCAALSPGLLESELFGHVKGAFTNAIRDKVGRFESAHGGTVFLDEIGDVSLEVQVKLLRVLQEMTFERVGSSEPVKVDVRVIAATHQNLEALIRAGRFREDLFYRLNVLPITVPPLRERCEDIAELVQHFLRVYSRKLGKDVTGVDDDALAALKACRWPGNVRQLENVIERAVVVAEKPVIGLEDLPADVQADDLSALEDAAEESTSPPFAQDNGDPAGVSFVEARRRERERRQREQLVRALAAAGGNKTDAARALGIPRSTLVSRLKRLGLS